MTEPPISTTGASMTSKLRERGPVPRDAAIHIVEQATKRRKSRRRAESGRLRRNSDVRVTNEDQNTSNTLDNHKPATDQQSPSYDSAEELLNKGKKHSSTSAAMEFTNVDDRAGRTSPAGNDFNASSTPRSRRKNRDKHGHRRAHAGSARSADANQTPDLTSTTAERVEAVEDGGRTWKPRDELSSKLGAERESSSHARDGLQNIPLDASEAQRPFVTGASKYSLGNENAPTIDAGVPERAAVPQKRERGHEPNGSLLFASVSSKVTRKQRNASSVPAPGESEDKKERALRRFQGSRHITEHRSSRDHRDQLAAAIRSDLRKRRRKIIQAYIVPLILLAALLVAVAGSELFRSTRSSRIVKLPSQVDREQPCSSKACLLVVAAVNGSIDYDAAPCADFYSHVCGRWNAPGSYLEVNRRLLNTRIEAELRREVLGAKQPKTTREEQNQHQMAQFFFSCRTFTSNPHRSSTQAVLQNIGIDITSWLAAATFGDLFYKILESAIRTGLKSIVAIRTAAVDCNGHDIRIFIDVGQDMYHAVNGQDGLLERFVDDALEDLQPQGINVSTLAVTNLDWSIAKVLEDIEFSSKFSGVDVKDLPVPPVNDGQQQPTWHKVLTDNVERNGTAEVFLKTEVVRARHLKEMSQAVARLHSVELTLARLYALLLPVVQVVRFFYLLQTPGDDRLKLCLRATGEHFKTVFPGWLARILEKTEAVGYFETLVTTIKYFAMRLPRALDRFNFSAIRHALLQVKTIGSSSGNMSTCSPALDAVRSVYGRDFLLNVALAAKVEPFGDNTASIRVEQQLSDTVHYDHDALVVPSTYLAEDLMHAKAAEPSLDYSTVGFRLLASWVQILVKQDPSYVERMAKYRRCILTKVPETVPFTENDPTLDAMLFAPWALDVAFVAAKSQVRVFEDEPPGDTASRDRLFLRRFCHTACGNPKEALVCNYATRHSEYFSAAFGCRPLPYIKC